MAQMAGASGLWRVGFGVRSHPMWPPRAGVPTKQGRTPPSQKVAIQMSACPPPSREFRCLSAPGWFVSARTRIGLAGREENRQPVSASARSRMRSPRKCRAGPPRTPQPLRRGATSWTLTRKRIRPPFGLTHTPRLSRPRSPGAPRREPRKQRLQWAPPAGLHPSKRFLCFPSGARGLLLAQAQLPTGAAVIGALFRPPGRTRRGLAPGLTLSGRLPARWPVAPLSPVGVQSPASGMPLTKGDPEHRRAAPAHSVRGSRPWAALPPLRWLQGLRRLESRGASGRVGAAAQQPRAGSRPPPATALCPQGTPSFPARNHASPESWRLGLPPAGSGRRSAESEPRRGPRGSCELVLPGRAGGPE